MHARRHPSLLTVTLALGLIGLTGCSSVSATPDGDQTGANRPAASAAPADANPAGSTGDGQAAPEGPVEFGRTVTYPDKVSIKVAKPTEFKPSEYAVAETEPGSKHVAFEVTVVNKSAEPVDLSLMLLTVQSGNTEAQQIFDSENKLEGTPSTKVQPGRESTFRVGFSVSDPNDIVMDVNPQDSFDRGDVTYTTK